MNMTDNYKTACFIGHRQTENAWNLTKELEAWLDKTIEHLISEQGVKYFICGNDIGLDMWEAKAVLKHKQLHPDTILEIAVPCEGHNATVAEVVEIQKNADIVTVVSQKQNRFAAYTERDRYMQEKSNVIIGVVPLVDGENKTRSTRRMLLHARAQGKEIFIIYKECEKQIYNGTH